MNWIEPESWQTPELSQRLQEIWQKPELACIVDTMKAHGHQAILVGGAVRDLLLQREVKDFDLLATCTAEQAIDLIKEISQKANVTVIPLDRKRGILRVCYRDSEGVDVTALIEPSMEADLRRRDATINAMAINPQGQLADPFDGRQDLRNRTVRMVAPDVLHSDPLRVLRCLRVAAALSFTIDPHTKEHLKLAAPGLENVAGERIGEELLRFLAHANQDHWRNLQQAEIVEHLWSLKTESIPWSLIDGYFGHHGPPRDEHESLGVLAAIFSDLAQKDPKLAEAKLERIKLSKARQRYIFQWWITQQTLREDRPRTSRDVYSITKQAGASLDSVLNFANRPEEARRLRQAQKGEGELRLDPLPLNGGDLCRHFDRQPGKWLGEVMTELEIAWATRQAESKEALLARAHLPGHDR